MAEAMNPLEELLHDELKDLYSAETQLVKALPKMAKKATAEELKTAFEEHLRQTEQHVERLADDAGGSEEHIGRLAADRARGAVARRRSPDGRNLVLLQLPVRCLEGPDSQRAIREGHPIVTVGHAATQGGSRLREPGRSAEWSETGLKILERLLAEVEVRVGREE